jgi:hypothetical protein
MRAENDVKRVFLREKAFAFVERILSTTHALEVATRWSRSSTREEHVKKNRLRID